MSENSSESVSCNILSTNFTLSSLGRGWEGIPASLIINILICSALLIGFSVIQWIVYKTKDQQPKDEQKIDWLHFIYGDKKTMKPFKSKIINRDHPLAYLPSVLHEYEHEITDKIEEEEFEGDLKIHSPGNKSGLRKVLPINQISENRVQINNSEIDGFDNEIAEETIRSQTKIETLPPVEDSDYVLTDHNITYDRNKDDKEKARLKTILLGTDSNDKRETVAKSEHKIKEYFGNFWILDYLIIKDEDILEYKGSDALQYLLFQRYIIYFLTALTFISLIIILPVNLYGNTVPEDKPFAKTTIDNLNLESNLLWIHAIMASLIVPMGIYMMLHFSKVIAVDKKRVDKKILLIEGIPESKRNTKILVDYLKKQFPNTVIKRITFIYNIKELEWMKNSLLTAIEAKNYCFEYKNKYNERLEVRPYYLGTFGGAFGCCSCCPKIDGLLFYAEEKAELEKDIQLEVKVLLSQPKGSAFVVFENKEMADEVYKDFKRKRCFCCNSCLEFIHWIISLFRSEDPLETYRWRVYYAPYPEDIEWLDIALEHGIRWLWNIGMNALLLLIFFFLTTPAIAVKYIEDTLSFQHDEQSFAGYKTSLFKYFSILLFMLMTTVLPSLIMLTQNQIPYRTKSASAHAMMYKSYVFLLLMVLILPSLGVLNIKILLESFFGSNIKNSFKWYCLFPTQSSAFFVNYILNSAFLENTFQIMRVPELALYLLYSRVISRTPAEYERARQETQFIFSFGVKYPRLMLMFTIVVTYSIACPLIAPCGLFYMVVKHLVDRYLIYFVYTPTKINCRIHSSAVLYVYIALYFLLWQLTSVLTFKKVSEPAIYMQFVIVILSLVLIYRCCKGWFKDIDGDE